MLSPKQALFTLLASHVLSRTGNVIGTFALPFLVLTQGGSPFAVGVVMFCATVPIVLGGAIGGVVVDRWGYARVAVISDALSAITTAFIPLALMTGHLDLRLLCILAACGALLDSPGETARKALLPDLALAAKYPLERSVGFLDATTRLSGLIGAPLTGLSIAAFGPQTTFTLTAGLLLVATGVGAALLRLPPVSSASQEQASSPSGGARAGLLQEFREGVRFLIREPVLRAIIAMVLLTNLLDAARMGTLLPLYAAEQLDGARSLGLIVGVFGACALTGSLVFGLVAHRVRRRPTIVWGFLIAGGPSLIAPALGADTLWLTVCSGISGLAAGTLNPVLGAIQLERIPRPLRGRVFGAVTTGAWAGVPLGGLLGGASAQVLSITTVFAVMAVVYTTIALSPLFGGAWRHLEDTRKTVE